MKKIKNLSFLLLITLAFSCCDSQKNIPLSIKNPECLFSFPVGEYAVADKNEVDLKTCEEQWIWEQDERWNIAKEEGFAYRIEFNKGNLYVVNLYYNSSGTGIFTNLILFEIKNNKFKLIENIAGGDRCQHGLITEEVKYEDGNIIYSELITPFHIMSWNNKELPFDAYDDCMVCCAASVKYKYNLKTRQKELINVELILEEAQGESQFSKIYNSFVQQSKTTLTEKELEDFITQVEKE